MISVVLSVTIPLALVGVWVFRKGMRGRMIDDHPLCRKCGFDLIGMKNLYVPGEEEKHCLECWADLRDVSRAVRTGHRKRRGGLVAAGLCVAISLVLIDGGIGLSKLEHIDWIKHGPAWYLIREARSSDPEINSQALDELMKRWRNDGLWSSSSEKVAVLLIDQTGSNSEAVRDRAFKELKERLTARAMQDSDINVLTARGLDYQADADKQWLTQWGDIIEEARSIGKLSDEQWIRYASQAVTYTVKTRAKIHPGDRLIVVIDSTCRVAEPSHLFVRMGIDRVGDDLVMMPRQNSMGFYRAFPVSEIEGSETYAFETRPDIAGLTNSRVFKLESHLTIFDSQPESGDGFDPPAVFDQKPHESASWMLAPKTTAIIQAIHNDALGPAIKNCLQIDLELGPDGKELIVSISLSKPPPLPLAFKVLIRTPAGEQSLGSMTCRCADDEPGGTFVPDWTGRNETKADIILKPDAGPLTDTLDMYSYWDGELVYKDVPIHK